MTSVSEMRRVLSRRARSRAAPRGRDDRGAAAGAGRRGQRQDPRAHAPHRLADRRLRHPARGDPGGHLHEQGRGRDARARRRSWSAAKPAAIWLSTFHSVCVRILRREASHLGSRAASRSTTNPTRSAVVKEAQKRHGLDPKVAEPRRMLWRIDQWKNQGVRPGRRRRGRARFRGAARRRRLRHLPAPAGGRERARLRRPAAAHLRSLQRASRRCCATTGSASSTCSSTSTRTRTACSTSW